MCSSGAVAEMAAGIYPMADARGWLSVGTAVGTSGWNCRTDRMAGAGSCAAVVTTGQWLSLWVDMRLGSQRSTMRGNRQHIRTYLKPHLGEVLLRDLTAARVQAMFTAIVRTHGATGRPLSAGTLQRIHATLQAGLNAAVRRGLIARNSARFVELASGRRPHVVVWTAQWKATGERPRVAVWTGGADRVVPHRYRRTPAVPVVPPGRVAGAAAR
jgi:hypothetical protein